MPVVRQCAIAVTRDDSVVVTRSRYKPVAETKQMLYDMLNALQHRAAYGNFIIYSTLVDSLGVEVFLTISDIGIVVDQKLPNEMLISMLRT